MHLTCAVNWRLCLGVHCIRQALWLWEEMLQGGMADVISFNAALSACVSRSDFAFQIFQEMEIRQVVPDRVSFNAMLSAAGQWEQVLNLLGKMRHSRYEADHISCSAAVLGCVRSQCWEVALSIFFDLARGADVVAWNSVLKAAPNWVMAVALLQQMRKVYLQPDLVACSTAISRCAEETDEFSWQVALRLLRLSEDRNEVTYGAAVTVMAKSAQWQQAMALLAEAEERRCLGTGTVNAAINACEQALRWQLAIVLLESLLEGPPYPDEISYCATIGACAAATQWAKALELSKDFTSAATLGAAMVACEVRGAWQHALAILQQMQHSSLEVSDLTFRAAMGACHSTVAMRWERSVDLLQRMQCAGLPPATLSHNFAITAIGRGMEWALALTAFRTVKHKLTAASGTFATTSSACDRGLQWAQTLELLRISNSEGLQSSMMIYGSSISAQEKVSHWRIGLGLLRSLRRQGLEAELVTCNSALSACEKGSIWAWALELISQEMLHKDVCCDEISFNAAIGACRENWCTAGLCLEAMQSQRLTPDVVTCGLLIRSEARFAWSPGELRAVTSQSLRDGPPRRQVESLELLEAIDGLADAAISSFKAATYQPSVYPALRELILKPAESGQGTHKKTPDVLHCVCVSV
eukprot:s3855_g3.t1